MGILLLLLALMGVRKPGVAVAPAPTLAPAMPTYAVPAVMPLPPAPIAPAPAPIVTALATPEQVVAAIAQAYEAEQEVITLQPVAWGGIPLSYNVPSIVAAAEYTGQPVADWLTYLGPAPTPESISAFNADQLRLRQRYLLQVGLPAPDGGTMKEWPNDIIVGADGLARPRVTWEWSAANP